MNSKRTRRGWRAGWPWVGATIAVGVASIASFASAATTTWINPRGGAWNDAANWSAGVPSASDVAVLPALRGGAYVIDVSADASIDSLVVNGNVTLIGDTTISTSGVADIGVGATSDGALTLSGVDLHVGTALRIGRSGGIGMLALADSTTKVVSGLALLGNDGTGTLDIAANASFTCVTVSLGRASTLKLVVAPAMAPAIVASNFTTGGALNVAFTPDVPLPILTPIVIIATANGAAIGSFASIVTPEFYGGQHPPVESAGSNLVIGFFNPIVQSWIEPIAPAAYVGFVEELELKAKRLSGATSYPTASAAWSVDPPDAGFVEALGNKRLLHALKPGSATLTASLPQYGTTIVTVTELTILANTGPVYEAIDVGSKGEAPDASVWGGYGPNSPATTVRCSTDGRFVVFADASTTFGPDPTPSRPDVYVKDRVTGALELVSTDPGIGSSVQKLDVDISADGRFVTYAVAPYPRSLGIIQVWLHDRERGTATLVSRTPAGLEANGNSYSGRISGDGSAIVFRSEATDLGPADSNGVDDVFSYDIATGTIALVSVAANGDQGVFDSDSPTISANGRLVAFTSLSDFGQAIPPSRRVWLKDRATGAIELVSVSTSGVPANGNTTSPAMDASGNIVVFRSGAGNLVPGPYLGYQLYVRDRVAGTTTYFDPSVYFELDCANNMQMPVVSADGRFVAVETYTASSSDPFGATSCAILRFDRVTGQRSFIAETPWGSAAPGYVTQPALSGDGSIAFFVAPPALLLPFGGNLHLFARIFGGVNSADLDRDGIVGPADLTILLGAWGSTGHGDLDGDGIVGPTDIAVLLGAWTVGK